jgi:hypothetical protein
VKDIPGLMPTPSKSKHLKRNGESNNDGKPISTYQHDYIQSLKHQRPVEDRLMLDSTVPKGKKKAKTQKRNRESFNQKNPNQVETVKEDTKKQMIDKLKQESRKLPNTAFKTYFGKPPFENYGNGNLKPSVGGHLYGEYMKTHNINPHSGKYKPDFRQSYRPALEKSQRSPPREAHVPFKIIQDVNFFFFFFSFDKEINVLKN